MRVLYCWDLGAISSLINRYMSYKYNHIGTVLMRRDSDRYGLSAYYSPPCRLVGGGARLFYLQAAMTAPRQDILYVDASLGRINLLKKISMGAKVVMHYHGSDVRNIPYEARRDKEKNADHIMVATPDLLNYKFSTEPTHLPIPVDTELYSSRDIPSNNRGIVFMKLGQKSEPTLQRLRDMGFGDIKWDLIPHPHDVNVATATSGETPPHGDLNRVQYHTMPAKLSQYQYYGGIYWNSFSKSWYEMSSTTDLQALSLGLTLVRYDGAVVKELPPEHRPEEVASRVKAIYDTLLE